MQDIICKYICYEVLLREVSPKTVIKNYIGSVQRDFVIKRIHNNYGVAATSRFVGMVKSGIMRIWSHLHPQSGGRKIAFTLNMASHIPQALERPVTSCQQETRFVEILAVRVGICFLLRKSEFLPSGSPLSTGMLWDKVHFFDDHGVLIPWPSVGVIEAVTVVVMIPYSKTDQNGMGRYITHHRQPNGQVCIVTDLEGWGLFMRLKYGAVHKDPVFGNGALWQVSSTRVAAVMKATAVYLGLNPSAVSAHSLRYGGATVLAMAGLPQYIIECYGGWAPGSESVEIYAQVQGDAARNVSRVMSTAAGESLSDSRVRNHFARR
jgi:hypothetical protein